MKEKRKENNVNLGWPIKKRYLRSLGHIGCALGMKDNFPLNTHRLVKIMTIYSTEILRKNPSLKTRKYMPIQHTHKKVNYYVLV